MVMMLTAKMTAKRMPATAPAIGVAARCSTFDVYLRELGVRLPSAPPTLDGSLMVSFFAGPLRLADDSIASAHGAGVPTTSRLWDAIRI